jgi:hypothetical protein
VSTPKKWLLSISLMLLGMFLSIGTSVEINPIVRAAPNSAIVVLGGERIQHGSPAVADFDGDGDKEIVVGAYDGMLYVVAYNGSSWSVVWSRQTALDLNAANPPKPTSTSRIESAPAVADLDGDGDLEIVVTTGGLPQDHLNGGLLVYSYQTASPTWSFAVDGDWPQPKLDIVGSGSGASNPDGYWDGIYASPAVGDLDGDGDLEIVFEGEDRRIHAYRHTGAVVDSWPIAEMNGDLIIRGGLSSPALADIDGDGLPEVIVGGNNPKWLEGSSADKSFATVWAFNGDSTLVPGWPQHVRQWVDSSPAVGDIDNDGELEIVVGTGRPGISGSGGRQVFAWNSDGSMVSGWPRPTGANMLGSPALADLDEDGTLDVIIGCGIEANESCTFLYAWRGDGTDLPGFPMQPLDPNPGNHQPQVQPYPPIVADIDTDGRLEILLVMIGSFGISVVEHNGVMSQDYSRIQDGFYPVFSPPVVDDVDNDGFLETILGGESNGQAAIYIWDETGAATNELPWPMFHHDVARTGRALFPPELGFPGEIRFLHQQGSGAIATLQVAIQNLGEQEFEWTITNPIADLQVSNISGTLSTQTILQLTLDTTGYSPDTWHNLGNLTVSGTLRGQQVASSPITVPVWLYIGDITQVYLPLVSR